MVNQVSKTNRLKKAVRTVTGLLVLCVGLIIIPYPGPGWLIVFAGLAILARDYPMAQKILTAVKAKYELWQSWLRKQPVAVKIVFWLLTGVIVIVTIWLLNGYGLLNSLLQLNLDYLNSPLGIFNP